MRERDSINVYELEVFCNHGVYEEEKALGQKFLLSFTAVLPLREAAKTDDLNRTVNYGEMCREAERFLKENTFQLIEAASGQLAEFFLLRYPQIEEIRLELKKPWAPIQMSVKTVSVRAERVWHNAYLSIGSNMGEREAYLLFAVEELKKEKGIRVDQVSSFVETSPYGVTDQPDFLNACLELRTFYTPHELLTLLLSVEQKADRVRTKRWGPRTLDLDLVFYDREIVDTKNLCVPHPEMQKREFVLKPLCEIAPYYRHPILNQTVSELYEQLLEKDM